MNYKEFAVSLANEAGAIIKNSFLQNHTTTWKVDHSPVSEVDLQIHNLVTKRVQETFPAHSVLSEEAVERVNLSSEFVWVCDPLDGTISFIHGIPTATFSMALVQNGKPIVGVIKDPFIERLFYAELGKGAFQNETKIQVSTDTEWKRRLVGLSLWGGAKYDLASLVPPLQAQLARTIDLAANVYMGALVAAGDIVGVIYNDNQAHDAAAVKIIVEEAGGRVTDLEGNEQRYDRKIQGMIASNGLLHDQLVSLVAQNRSSVFKQ